MRRRHSLNNEEKAEFLTRIGGLLEQGYTISECIEFFLKYEHKKVKPLLNVMLQQLEKGGALSGVLAVLQMPKNIISFVYFAEHYGNLAHGLIEGGKILRKTAENKQKFHKLLRYPIFLLWSLTVFMIILYYYLFPQFSLLFSSMNIQLPLITRMLLSFIEQIPYYALASVLIGGSLIIYYLFVFRKKDELYKARKLSNIPFIGHYYQMMITYYFSTTLSCLMKSGMSIYEALSIFHEQDEQRYVGMEAKQLINHLEKGERFHLALLNNTVYLKELSYIVHHGQVNGRLDEELDHYSKWLLDDFDHKLKNLFAIIQPILFLFIGIIVLLMFASIILPIFTIVDGI